VVSGVGGLWGGGGRNGTGPGGLMEEKKGKKKKNLKLPTEETTYRNPKTKTRLGLPQRV